MSEELYEKYISNVLVSGDNQNWESNLWKDYVKKNISRKPSPTELKNIAKFMYFSAILGEVLCLNSTWFIEKKSTKDLKKILENYKILLNKYGILNNQFFVSKPSLYIKENAGKYKDVNLKSIIKTPEKKKEITKKKTKKASPKIAKKKTTKK